MFPNQICFFENLKILQIWKFSENLKILQKSENSSKISTVLSLLNLITLFCRDFE